MRGAHLLCCCFVTLLPLSLLCMCRDFLKAYCLQLGIMANHQNGRDTHVRGIKVFAPQQDALQPLHQEVGFSTVDFSQYATVR